MTALLDRSEFELVGAGYVAGAPERSSTLNARCYTDPRFLEVEREAIFHRSWQWVCHAEKLREPGAYCVRDVMGRSVVVLRDPGEDGGLRAFYNVCQHRGHELLKGEGKARVIVCPYHGWAYNLDGRLRGAPRTDKLEGFDKGEIGLMPVQVEEFCGFVYVNLDPGAEALSTQSGGLAAEIARYAPDIGRLTFAHRLTFDIKANWKVVVDNFLECYHCPVAHKDFCSLLQFDTYRVTTHGIYSSHMAKASKDANTAYSTEGATVDDHAVWWLWPNTCLLRYPGRGNFLVLNIVPDGPGRTRETYDFFFEEAEPNGQEWEAINYIDRVLQREDIDIVESVQRGMATPAYECGRIVHDPDGSGMSEHAVHHFHGLLLEAYGHAVAG